MCTPSRGRPLTTPTRLLFGDADFALSTALLDGHGDVEVEVIPGAGHFLPEERPALVNEAALRFFSHA